MRKLIIILSCLCVLGVLSLQYMSRHRAKPVAAVQAPVIPETPAFIATHRPGILSVGNHHALFLADDDKVYGWGENEDAKLGRNDIGDINHPLPLQTPAQVLAIHTGSTASYLITQDGQLWRRGFADDQNQISPSPGKYFAVLSDKRWRKVEEHWGLSVGIENSGQLWAWQDTDFFKGNLNQNGKRELAQIELKAMSVASQWRDFCVAEGRFDAIDMQGNWWRSEPSGKLDFNGNVVHEGNTLPNSLFINLVRVPTSTKMQRVYCRDNAKHVIALDEHHKMWGYGRNQYGELGNGDDDPYKQTLPIEANNVEQLNQQTWIDVAIGTGFTIAIARDGSLWSWGLNTTKALGLDSEQPHHSKPKLVDKQQVWSAVAAGYDFAIAMNQEGELYVWGNNQHGQLADDKLLPQSLLPIKIAGVKNQKDK